jgi:hypothetical protein
MSPASDVARLLALERIRSLPVRYSIAIERRDVDAMAALFSPNARFGSWGDGEQGLRSLMGKTLQTTVFAVILVANHLIEIDDPDHAHGEVWARCYAQDEPNGFTEQLIKYEDTYERVAGRWLFLRRRHRLWFGVSSPSPLRQPPANWPKHQVGVGDVPLADPVFAVWYAERGRAAEAATPVRTASPTGPSAPAGAGGTPRNPRPPPRGRC